MDEARQVSYYQYNLEKIITSAASQQQPPLDYWIGHFVVKFSDSDFAVRLPAALFGSGTIIFIYLLAIRFCAWPLAAAISLVTALLPFNLYFSQEARPYAISIFFFLAMLWSLDSFLNTSRKFFLSGMFFLLSTLGFLYSRTLSPLSTIIVLFAVLCGDLIFLLLGRQSSDKNKFWKLLTAVGALLISFVLYLPKLLKILEFGRQYIKNESTVSDLIKTLSQNFNLMPIWQAFVVQTEPITIPLLVLLFFAPVLTLCFSQKHPQTLWPLILFLLPGATLLNIIVFQAKSAMPFRPPYAIYILPLALLISAGTLQALWNIQNVSRPFRQIFQTVVVSGCIFLIAGGVYGAVGYKSIQQRKTDWRSLGEHLSVYDNHQILLFHNSIVYTSGPVLRYYRGKSPIADVQNMFGPLSQEISPTAEPVFIFFQSGPYLLTEHSRYPIMPATRQLINAEEITIIQQNRNLTLTSFKNLFVIKLNSPTGNLARDSLTILDSILPFMNKQSELFDCYLLQAILAKYFDRADWKKLLLQAKLLAPSSRDLKLLEMEKLLFLDKKNKVSTKDIKQ